MLLGTDWLNIDYRTLFRLRADGRIARENDPDCSPGPRFWLGGCAEGNIFGVRADMPDDVTAELESLAAAEPPFAHPATPRYLERYLAVLARHHPVAHHNLGLIYELPHSLSCMRPAHLIGSDTDEGRDLMLALSTGGMPESLCELGFRNVADFWPPWCVAIVDGEIASIAFSARLSEVGAELGVATAKALRGRGLAAAATAVWSRLPSLQTHTLFYSTDRGNISSQRVTTRLGLLLRGASLRIA
jgi:hypothetical protein